MRLQSLVAVTFAAHVAIQPAFAAPSAEDVDRLVAALALPEMIEIMRDEGLTYGATIGTDLFQGEPSPDWDVTVDQIYNYDAMVTRISGGLGTALGDSNIQDMITFFEAEPGKSIVELEIAARRALMDEALEEASKEAAALALMDETPRAALVTRFIEANDLIETNVVGAMNSNYAFYIGLRDGGGFNTALTEDQILADVWSQEAEIRQNTSEWVYSYSLMAYQPLTDDVLETYIAFSQTDAGQALNAALFTVFDAMFEDISGALGRAASQQMMSQDL